MGPPLQALRRAGRTRWGGQLGAYGPPLALAALTVAAYWPDVFHRFGFRDDYPLLGEAQTEPGKILAVCTAQGRFFYGLILEHAMRWAESIDGLRWIRLTSAVGLGGLCAALFRVFVRAGWQAAFAALLASVLVLMPPAQVVVSWATCVPQVFALLLATVAFIFGERCGRLRAPRATDGGEASVRPLPLRLVFGALAVVSMACATLTYQSDALFYLVPVAAALAVRPGESLGQTFRWLTRHGIISSLGVLSALGLMNLSYALGWARRSPRIRYESDLLWKLEWAAREVLADSLAQPFLGGASGPWKAAYGGMLAVVVATIAVGLFLKARRSPARAVGWLVGLTVLPVGSFAVSLIAAERWSTYRSIYGLTGVWSVFFVASLQRLLSRSSPRVRQVVVAALIALWAVLARRHSLELFAIPQGHELAIMEEGARRLAESPSRWVYVITASQSDTSAPLRYRDEFGSVSLDAGWIIEKVLTLLLQERLPHGPHSLLYDRFVAGPIEPPVGLYDVVIDLRAMASHRE